MQWRRSHAEILIFSKGANGAKAPQPRPSILAVVVRIKGERGESIFSNTFSLRTTKNIEPASSHSFSSKGTRTIRSARGSTTATSGRHMASRSMNQVIDRLIDRSID